MISGICTVYTLGMSDHQIAAGNGCMIEAFDQCIFGGLVEVNHYVSAENNVETCLEFDGVHQIEGTENDIIFEFIGNHNLFGICRFHEGAGYLSF